MNYIKGYVLDHVLNETEQTTVVRARREADQRFYVLKILKNPHYSVEELSHFYHEYDINHGLDLHYSIKNIELVKNQDYLFLVEEDFDGVSLRTLLTQHTFTILEFLQIAIPLAKGVAELHDHHIIHKDINPNNILWNTTTKELRLIDFDLATDLKKEQLEVGRVMEIEGTLSYISPEQTRRINRTIDHRTDFYSIGVTFYEILTGTLPFEETEASELIYAHIAKMPIPPHILNKSIPEGLSLIVMKLLEKNAEDRYKSAGGLIADLKQCLKDYEEKQDISLFTLAMHDIPIQLNIPEKLYGRAEELATLQHAFAQTIQGFNQAVFIGGNPGIGKSSLVHELYREISGKSGYLINGNYDQLQRNIPYYGFKQAFHELIRQIVAHDKTNIPLWKDKFLEVLGQNGQVIIDVIPEVEWIIGKQPQVVEVSGNEAIQRFIFMFVKFVNAIATKEHPLVIFLDNIQWADIASMHLLEALTTNSTISHCLTIAAYRDNEISSYHSLILDEIKASHLHYDEITLQSLTIFNVEQIIADTLSEDVTVIKPLAEICYQKTQGNPYFVNYFLNELYDEHLLEYHAETHTWKWDINEIITKDITSNVIDLLIQKMEKLPEKGKKLLELAACLGNQFQFSQLSFVSNNSFEELTNILKLLLREGFILPLDHSYKYVIVGTEAAVSYRFSHDRVQQAAYAMLDEMEKIKLHLKIGRFLKKAITEQSSPSSLDIFNISNHINLAFSFVSDPQEKHEMAYYNLQAGLHAIRANTYEIALKYFKFGMRYLSSHAWKQDYALIFQLHYNYAASLLSIGKPLLAKRKLTWLLRKAHRNQDKVEVYLKLVELFESRAQYQQEIQTTFKALALLGETVPDLQSATTVQEEVKKTKSYLEKIHIQELLDKPILQENAITKILEIYYRMWNPAMLIIDSNLVQFVSHRLLNLTFEHGNNPYGSFACISYGILLCQIGDISTGVQFGQVGIALINKYNFSIIIGQAYFAYAFLLHHLQYPIKECLPYFKQGYLSSIETGNINSAGSNAHQTLSTLMFMGEPLTEIETTLTHYLPAIKKINVDENMCLIIINHVCLTLQNKEDVAWHEYDRKEKEWLEFFHEKKMVRSEFTYLAREAFLDYYLDKFDEARFLQEQLKSFYKKKFAPSIFLWVFHYFYYPLTLLALYRKVNERTRKKYLKIIKYYSAILEKFSKFNSDNYLNKYLLLQAELAAVQNQIPEAIRFYNEAIEVARTQGFNPEEALANELLGKLYITLTDHVSAKSHFQAAYHKYAIWGATAKLRLLEKSYLEFSLGKEAKAGSAKPARSISKEHLLNIELDFNNVLKALQAISSEIQLEKLISNILRIMSEVASAEKSALLLNKNQQLLVQGIYAEHGSRQAILINQSLQESNEVWRSIIDYVWLNQHELLIENAESDERYNHDEYFLENRPKSILAMPIFYQGKSIGIIYFENKFITNAFTPDRLDTLRYLAIQSAIAVENAQLYHAIERFFPKQFLQLLNKRNIMDIELGDNIQRDVSILFVDIRNFTSLVEKSLPDYVFQFLNHYLSYAEPIITLHNGFIDKYIGDAIMAIFPRNANDAVDAAIQLFDATARINQDTLFDLPSPLNIGVGISSGTSLLGAVGSRDRLDGTVISDATNTASRVENLNKTYGTNILITQHTLKSLRDVRQYHIRLIDHVRVKGKTNVLFLYEILDGLSQEAFEQKLNSQSGFEKAFTHYQKGDFFEAKHLFEQCLQLAPLDKAAQLYVDRCNRMIHHPPAQWDGIWEYH